jgi:hypothetical protein
MLNDYIPDYTELHRIYEDEEERYLRLFDEEREDKSKDDDFMFEEDDL